jgi:hypothetical protein
MAAQAVGLAEKAKRMPWKGVSNDGFKRQDTVVCVHECCFGALGVMAA